jgi:hypothetical protein
MMVYGRMLHELVTHMQQKDATVTGSENSTRLKEIRQDCVSEEPFLSFEGYDC